MPHKLGFTGMDPATEAELRAAFDAVGKNIAGWELVSGSDAGHVVVDMDSMYGPMSWIRLHGEGREVVGLTAAARSHANHHLGRPIDARALADLLTGIAQGLRSAQAATDSAPPTATVTEPSPRHAEIPTTGTESTTTQAAVEQAAATSPMVDTLPVSGTPAPAPADLLAEEQPLPPDEESQPPPEAAATLEPIHADAASQVGGEPKPKPALDPTPAARAEPEATPAAPDSAVTGRGSPSATGAPLAPTTAAPRSPSPQTPPTARPLAAWLTTGGPAARWGYRRDGIAVFVDATSGEYFGPAQLKPLEPLFSGTVSADALEPLADEAWRAAVARAGAAQPLARLKWFGGLLAGQGELLGGNDPTARYRLLKWPQSEREFPRHFRIARVMMKAPATLAEIAASSGTNAAEAADFINASLASGYAEAVSETPASAAEAKAPRGGLLGRLRRR